jgi:hypothetical protein
MMLGGGHAAQNERELRGHRFFWPGVFPQPSSVITFRETAFHPPYAALGMRLRSASGLTTGIKGYLTVPFGCIIQRMMLLANAPGNVVIDIYRLSAAQIAAGAVPTPPNTLIAIAKFRPTLNNAQSTQDWALLTWSRILNAGDVLAFDVLANSAAGPRALTITLLVSTNDQR